MTTPNQPGLYRDPAATRLRDLRSAWEAQLEAAADGSGNAADRVLGAWRARPDHISSDFLETGIVQMVKGWLDAADGYALQEGRRIADDAYAGEAWFQTGGELRRLLRMLSFKGLGAGRTTGSHPVEVLIDAALELEGREPDGTITHAARRLLDR